jgi:AraC-like DNA-binding protein
MPARLLTVAPPAEASFRCVRVREQKLVAAWHFHPEYQLTLVRRGCGQRLVGDSFEPLEPGDLTLLGPNLPHFWDVDMARAPRREERARRVDAVIVQFRAEFLGREFWGVPETAAVVGLLHSASRGLVFPAAACNRVAAEIVRLPTLAGLQRLLALIGVLDRLATGGRPRLLASAGYTPRFVEQERDRFATIVELIHARLDAAADPPGRGELARIAGLAERSFSRTFHARFGKTLPQFVNELRVGRARRLLLDTALSVAEVARACGFKNLSNFNAQFRRIAGLTPAAVRRRPAP